MREEEFKIETCWKKIEMERIGKDHLQKRVSEVLYLCGIDYRYFFVQCFNLGCFLKLNASFRSIDVERL